MDLGTTGTGNTEQVDGDLLQATNVKQELMVNITTNARHPSTGATLLPAGTILTKVNSGSDDGLYKEFDNGAADGSEDESNAVILAHAVDVDDHTDKVVATVYEDCKVKEDKVVGDVTNFDESKQQNITIWRE